MTNRVAQQHRLGLGEVTIVEYEQKFATVGVKTLNRMRQAAGEKPKIAIFCIGDKAFAAFVDRRDPRGAVKHDGPFRGGVPMQLPPAAGCESHIYAGHIFGDGQLTPGDLARPSALVNTFVRKGEWILERWDQTLGVSGGWPHRIRVLTIKHLIGWTRIAHVPVCTDDFLQCGKAADCGSGCSDETATSKCAHDYVSCGFRVCIGNLKLFTSRAPHLEQNGDQDQRYAAPDK